jgi:hypothetical protein
VLESKNKRSLRSLTGLFIILLIYTILALAAYTFYPQDFSPLTNTLTQLGNPILNPSGAIFYNIGVLLVSGSTVFIAVLLLILPKQWLTPRGGNRRLFFYLSTSFMMLFSFFYMLTAFVPSGGDDAVNSLFTLIFIVSLELFIVFSAAGARRMKDHLRWVPAFGFTIAAVNLLLIVVSAISGLQIISWILPVATWSYMLAFIYEFSYTG